MFYYFYCSLVSHNGDIREIYPVEGCTFYNAVECHVHENQFVAPFKWFFKGVIAHDVSGETAWPCKSICIFIPIRFVGH